jgi:hypothetical protein
MKRPSRYIGKLCCRHPQFSGQRYNSDSRCVECSRLRRRAQRAKARKKRGPKPPSARQRALKAGRKYYVGCPCVRHGKKALRWVRGGGCLLCHREVYPDRLSATAKEKKRIRMRDYARRRARAFRILTALGGPALGV